MIRYETHVECDGCYCAHESHCITDAPDAKGAWESARQDGWVRESRKPVISRRYAFYYYCPDCIQKRKQPKLKSDR